MVLALGLSNVALGQYDDLYYDPDRDAGTYNTGIDKSRPADNAVTTSRYDEEEGDYDNNTASYDQGYDDDEYEYYDDYDYYYTARVRRFHRPYYGFSYFDPVYADLYYYDPFINPGVTVLIYDGYSSWNSWNSWRRWNRWNSWGSFNRGWGGGWGNGWNNWNSWNDPWYGGGWNNGMIHGTATTTTSITTMVVAAGTTGVATAIIARHLGATATTTTPSIPTTIPIMGHARPVQP